MLRVAYPQQTLAPAGGARDWRSVGPRLGLSMVDGARRRCARIVCDRARPQTVPAYTSVQGKRLLNAVDGLHLRCCESLTISALGGRDRCPLLSLPLAGRWARGVATAGAPCELGV